MRRIAVFLIAEIDAERAADDRLDAGAGHLLGEFQRTEHVVGVGQRQRRLAVLFGKLRQPRDRQRALEQRIGRMDVQMDEAGLSGCCYWTSDHCSGTLLRASRCRARADRSMATTRCDSRTRKDDGS